ncbi:hypothetical protein CN907_26750 [Bacillus anthracis]|nr:hypothetical protein CN907_26750 [Bacillus anthracis]
MKKIILAGALGMATLAGTNLPGLEVTKASAAVESNMSTIEGRVVEVTENTIYIEVKESNEHIDNTNRFSITTTNFNPNIKVGDDIKATGAMMRNFEDYMIAQSVEKVQGTDTLHQGKYLEHVFAYEYEIGYITKVGKVQSEDYVIVQYTGKDGIQKKNVTVYLTKGQKFNTDEKVKVHMANAERSNEWSVIDEIEKVNDSQTQINPILNREVNGYVTGEITEIGDNSNEFNYVIVPYINQYGQKETIEVRLTQGQQFKLGDKVRINMEFAFGRGNINADATVIDNIQKINKTNTQSHQDDRWIWS